MKSLLMILICSLQLAATTLTGTLKGPDGTGVNGVLYMSLSQQAALLSTGGCGGPVEIVPGVLGPQAGYSIAIKVVSGAMQSPPAIYGNDCMLPGGLYYNVALLDNNGNTYFTDKWQITGSTIDVGTIVSVVISGTTQTLGSTGFVQLVPAGTQVINQPPGTYLGVNTMAVTGTLTLPDGSQCTTSGCFAFSNVVQLTGNQTISGNKTFASDIWGQINASVGTTANPFLNGNFAGTVSGGIALDLYNHNGTGYMHTVLPSSGNFTMTQYFGGSDLGGGGTPYPYPMLSYFPGSCIGPSCTPVGQLLTMGASMNPANTAFSLGTASLPWSSVYGVNVIATGSLTVGPVGNFYNRVFSGADIVCTGVNDGWMGFRTDTQQIELCQGSAVYKITATP